MDGTLLVIAVLIGLIPASIASNKGHNFLVWWFFGAALFIVALPLAIMLKPDVKEIEQSQIQSGEMKKCPYCAELIKQEAIVCRYCGKDLPIAMPATATPTNEEIQITKEEFSKLTYRQRFAVTEFGYLLSPEDAEAVGKMLGNMAKNEAIISFCKMNGEKVLGYKE